MSDTYKVLYQGLLAASAGLLATVPTAKAWIIKCIDVTNVDSSSRTFTLFVGGSGDANQIMNGSLAATGSAGASVADGKTRTLEAAKTIYGVGSVASKVAVTIYGLEIDV